MNRRVWILILIVVLIASLGIFALWSWKSAHSQTITLPNGIEYRFAGITEGTNHVMGPGLAKALDKLPDAIGNFASRILGGRVGPLQRRTSSGPSICFWFQSMSLNTPAGPQPSGVYVMIADENGVISGDRQYVSTWSTAGGLSWLHEDFAHVPRRSRKLQCVFFKSSSGGEYEEFGRIEVRNPYFETFPDWGPELLPAVKMAGDVEVRLEKFRTGHNSSTFSRTGSDGETIHGYGVAEPGDEIRSAFQLKFDSPRGTNEVWGLEGAELSDATGNHLRAPSRSSAGDGWFAIGPSLWPDEKAWRVKLELERKAGLAPEELAVFTNIAVPAIHQTNTFNVTNQTGGVGVVLKQFIRRPDITNSSWSSSETSVIRIEYPKLPEGVSVDYLKTTTDDGAEVKHSGSSWSDTFHEVTFKTLPTNVSHLNITFSVQRTRTVEFLVKPEMATPELD